MTQVYIITGEPSGDLLGVRLMQAIRRLRPDIAFKGVGGERMIAEGLNPLFPQSDLAVFGLWEILPKIMLIFRRLKQTVQAVETDRPAVVITIDSPDFCFRVGKRLKRLGIPLLHYVAPSVWAWRPGRAKKIAQFLTHILTLFKFEPPYFEKEGLAATFVGHPIIENGADRGDGQQFRAKYGLAGDVPVLTVLPGSRKSEVRYLLSIFKEVVERARQTQPTLVVALPTMPTVEKTVRDSIANWDVPVHVVTSDGDKYDAFAASTAALGASGTVNLEVALANLPMVMAYKISPVTAFLYRSFINIRLFSPINVLLKREAVPECVQENCTADNIAAKLLPLLQSEQNRAVQKQAYAELRPLLQEGQETPSDRAARVILSYLPHAGTC
ncbi:MAG: lipid-A-disaccharide synthase [Bdellovibrionales bacterium]